MRRLYLLVLAGLLVTGVGFAAGNSRIILNDGTTIFGKVVGMNDGVYVIRTDTMGDINVNADNVVEISANTCKASAPAQQKMNILDGASRRSNSSDDNESTANRYAQQQQDATTRVQSMMMNENFMENMMQLGNSPEMQNVLNDEEVMNAISNGDYDYLMNNPKMNELMNSSGIQGILGDM